MRVLLPCLFSSPFFALFFSFPFNSTFVCCLPPSCAYLGFQILLPLTESHLPNAITLPSPFRLFSSSLVTLIDAGLCLGDLTTQQLWGFTCTTVWSNLREVNNSPLSIFKKTLNDSTFHHPTVPHPLCHLQQNLDSIFLQFDLQYPLSCYPLNTKIVPQKFEFKGCDTYKLPCGKNFICLNTVTSL